MSELIPRPYPGMWLTGSPGDVRVDMVKGGWVFFVSWRPEQEFGRPTRMPIETFQHACLEHGMKEATG